MKFRNIMIKILLCLTFLSIVGLSMAQMPRNIPKPTNPYGPKPGRLQCGLKTFFTYHGIVPQCFDHVPNKTCNVTYMMDVKIDPGFDYDQFEIQGEPMITWEADNNTFYLMLMMGWTTWYTYIVPSTPNDLLLNTDENEWIQWLVYDIPGMKIRKGKTFYQYMELQQPPHYWKHTYVFAIFKQHQGKLKDFVPPRLLRMGDHEFTKVKEFLRANKLRDPVAANIFNYRYMPDEYGPNIGYSSTLDSQFWAEKPTPIPYEHIQFDPNRKDYSVETVEV